MSNPTQGRMPPNPNLCLAPDHLKILAYVHPECIEHGYNVVGWTVISVNVADLPTECRSTLRTMIAVARKDWRARFDRDIVKDDGVIDFRGTAYDVRLSVPTASAFEEFLVNLRHVFNFEDKVRHAEDSLERMLTSTVIRTLKSIPAKAGNFSIGCFDKPVPQSKLAKAIIDRLPAEMDAVIKDLNGFKAGLHKHTGKAEWAPVTSMEWVMDRLYDAPLGCFGQKDWPADHRHEFDALCERHIQERFAHAYATSPKGMVEEILTRLGTPSQVERWKEGFLPDAEADAVIATHLFDATLKVASPEVRLDKDSVSDALRKAVPGASVTKVSFSTEEANGLDEIEWAAFKALRSSLPEGASANVVRTVASVQTTSHGPFAVRRPLASLKASFAGRDIRIRVDLGTGMRVEAA